MRPEMKLGSWTEETGAGVSQMELLSEAMQIQQCCRGSDFKYLQFSLFHVNE